MTETLVPSTYPALEAEAWLALERNTPTLPPPSRLPSDLALLESADPVAHSVRFLARRRAARAEAELAAEGSTQIETE